MKQRWTSEEIKEFWTLSPQEMPLLKNKTGDTRLGFIVMLKFFQNFGRFPNKENHIPSQIIIHLAKQVSVDDALYFTYDAASRAAKEHKKQIRNFCGFRGCNKNDKINVKKYLIESVLPEGNHSHKYLKEVAYDFFKKSYIEPLSEGSLSRCIRSALTSYEDILFKTIADALSQPQQEILNALIDEDQNQEDIIPLVHLKQGSGKTALESIFKAIQKLSYIQKVNLPVNILKTIPVRVINQYAQRIMSCPPNEVRNYNSQKRYALLSQFCFIQSQNITDDLVELLIKFTHRLHKNAEQSVNKKLISEIKTVTGKPGLLLKLAKAAIGQPKGIVEEVLFPVVDESTLKDVIKESEATRSYRELIHDSMRSSYKSHYRRMLEPILNTLEFKSNNQFYQPIIEALNFINGHINSKSQFYPEDVQVPIEGVIAPSLQSLVQEASSHKINRISYEILTLLALRNKLRCKEIWVVGAASYRNPDDDLPLDFVDRREEYYQAVGKSLDPEEFIQPLISELSSALAKFNKNIPKNKKVKILSRKGKSRIKVTPLKEQPLPPHLEELKQDVFNQWPNISLLDILKEADLRIDFTSEFTSLGSREYIDKLALQHRLILSIYGYGSNTGLKRIASGNTEVNYEDLRYIRRRYLLPGHVRNAIIKIVNTLLEERESIYWGEDITSCACDSKHFGAWDQNLLTEWHARYRHYGVMIYWHIDKKSACIFSQLKSCTSSEVAAMMEGVLRHCTDAEISKTYVDSHGQSLVGFAFSFMLGFKLLPRLKAISKQKLSVVTSEDAANYKNLSLILTDAIKWHLIRQQYDEIVKFTTALRLGTADSEAILRRFTRNNIQHPTYQALLELGKVIKTIFLCHYLHSESLRQEIHEGLNVVERWNGVNNFIFYGRSREFSSNRREDQELSVFCLHLLQLCLVYINTLMLQSVLKSQKWRDRLTDNDKRALTPLIHEHINPYGLFFLDMSKRLHIPKHGVHLHA